MRGAHGSRPMDTHLDDVLKSHEEALLLQPVGADAADDGLPLYLAELVGQN